MLWTHKNISCMMLTYGMRQFAISHTGKNDRHLIYTGGHGKYSKNPYPLRNRIIPNKVTIKAPKPWRPSGSWSHGGCQGVNYEISQWVWVLAFISWPPMGMGITGCWEIVSPKTPFSHLFQHWSWENDQVIEAKKSGHAFRLKSAILLNHVSYSRECQNIEYTVKFSSR